MRDKISVIFNLLEKSNNVQETAQKIQTILQSKRTQDIVNLLSRAFETARGTEMYRTIQKRLERLRQDIDEDKKQYNFDTFMKENEGQGRAVRALNFLAQQEGLDLRYYETGASPSQEKPKKTGICVLLLLGKSLCLSTV